MSYKCLCQSAFKRNGFAIAFTAMFALHSPLSLADQHTQSSDASNAGSSASDSNVQGFKMQENAFDFPAWPVKQVVVKDVPPPPPLGPYMSTALNNEQAGKPRFRSMMSIPVPNFEEIPMTTFSPDLPWPEDDGSVNRWAPDKGYTFVAPNVRPPQPFFNQRGQRANVKPNSVNPQRQGRNYLRGPMPASIYNKAMNNGPMYSRPATRAPNVNYPGTNYPVSNYSRSNYSGYNRPGSNSAASYYSPANQPRRNQQMQQRNLPVNQNNGRNNNIRHYSNGMGQRPRPQVNTDYNRSAYGVTRPPQMTPSSVHQR